MKIHYVLFFVVCLCGVFFSCVTRNAILREHLSSLRSKDEVVIVILGDSISGGGGISGTGSSYGSFLKPMLGNLFTSRISLINTSREDESYRFAHRRIQEDILSYRPDIAFVMLGIVDAFTPGLLLSTHINNVNNFYSILKDDGVFVIVLTTTWLRDVDSRNDSRYRRLNEFNDVIRDYARYYHYPVIDVAQHMEKLMLSKPDEYRSLFSDAVLLNNEGKKFIADYIYQRFLNILDENH